VNYSLRAVRVLRCIQLLGRVYANRIKETLILVSPGKMICKRFTVHRQQLKLRSELSLEMKCSVQCFVLCVFVWTPMPMQECAFPSLPRQQFVWSVPRRLCRRLSSRKKRTWWREKRRRRLSSVESKSALWTRLFSIQPLARRQSREMGVDRCGQLQVPPGLLWPSLYKEHLVEATMTTFQAWNSTAKCIDNPLILPGRSAGNDWTTRKAAACVVF